MFSRKMRAAGLAALALGSMSAAAHADWIVRVGGAWAEPAGNAFTIPPHAAPLPTTAAGLNLGSDGPALFGDVTWLFKDHLGLEFWINAPFSSDMQLDSTAGRSKVGKVDYMSPMLNLQWHFNPEGSFRPYVGAGIVDSVFSGEKPTALKVSDDFSWTVGGGIDFGARDHGWFGNIFAKYIDMSSSASATFSAPGVGVSPPIFPPLATNQFTVKGSFDVSPWVYGISVGYKFGAKEAAYVAPAAAVVAAAPVAATPRKPVDGDADGDGVVDSKDMCPNTPRGDRVGPYGCSCDVTVQLNFASNSAVIADEDKVKLDALAKRLQELKFVGGEAGGHTDSTGDAAYNLGLSKRRAQAVIDYLGTKGVAASRITAAGYGETMPMADNSTAEGRAMNRRVVLRRTDCGPAPK
jgi:outer membrane protein OmpA-like peptidoglycan-associated protein/outer membrane protein W